MKDFKKYVAEFMGTMMLVIFGCGSAVAVNQLLMTDVVQPLGFSTLLIAFAFGLIVVAMAYAIGSISGCHINPAVSLGFYATGKMKTNDFIRYLISQFLGGIVGAAILVIIFNSNTALGANGFGELSALGVVWYRAFLVEIILTFIFVLVVLSISAKKEHSNISGLVIGFTLTLVHILGIPFTGTSVNPARSLGSALFTGGLALEQVWLFMLAPLCGSLLAALFYHFIIEEKK